MPLRARYWLLLLDAVAVLGFAAIGLRTHDRAWTIGGVVETAAPFLIGVAAGWLLVGAWREPDDLRRGLGVWAATVAVGVVLRRFVFDQGTAITFVLVAACFLALFLLGWRLAARRAVAAR
jgi:hypothetical protein